MLSKYIHDLSAQHLKKGIITPITRSPCIIPIKNTPLWSYETKFTISLWLQLRTAPMQKSNRNAEKTHYNIVINQVHI